jgi:hypothetical protein
MSIDLYDGHTSPAGAPPMCLADMADPAEAKKIRNALDQKDLAGESELVLVGTKVRRDLVIRFDRFSRACHFTVSIHPKGKGPYFHRRHIAFVTGEHMTVTEKNTDYRRLFVGSALLPISLPEAERIEAWLASLPAEGNL